MPKVMARQCPWTKKLFPITHKKNYFNHLMKEREKMKIARDKKRLDNEFNAFREKLLKSKSIDQIIRFLLDNQDIIFNYSSSFEASRTGMTFEEINSVKKTMPVLTRIVFERMKYKDSVNNSHNAPFGKQRNWHRKNSLPKGYRGFYGRVQFMGTNLCQGSISLSGIMTKLGISTGSGGGGSNKLSYECILWCDDFTELNSQVIHQRIEHRQKEHDRVEHETQEAMVRKLKGKHTYVVPMRPYEKVLNGDGSTSDHEDIKKDT